MPEPELEIVRITVFGEISAGDLDELVASLDEAGLDAVIEPAPNRMGFSGLDLVELAIEIPLETLGAVLLTAAGRRIWEALTVLVRRLLEREPRRPEPVDRNEDVVVTVHDVHTRLRLDLTLQDLADDRLLEVLARLGLVARKEGPVPLRWNAETGGFTVDSSDSSR
ncbi:MAG TPA: hypothetical protein VFC19_52840 [Candidatus Limnocylindrales bacterium]|nr:hypothetical protein [Candidatus Limnocylindrales bacterium]